MKELYRDEHGWWVGTKGCPLNHRLIGSPTMTEKEAREAVRPDFGDVKVDRRRRVIYDDVEL